MLKQLFYELTRGFAYRSITHAEMRAYTLWLPLALTAILLGMYAVLPTRPILLGKDGFVSSLLTLMSTLPGFYFAGLAAVATFGSPAMDQEMPSPAPEAWIRVGGQSVRVKLTRRQFLSYLFSYLVLLSFALSFVLMIADTMAGPIGSLHCALLQQAHGVWVWRGIKAAICAVFTFGLASMVVSTLHGVFSSQRKFISPDAGLPVPTQSPTTIASTIAHISTARGTGTLTET